MTKLRKRGFTLIELIAVLVIMAILALIVTALVMNIIRKARIAADKRSIDAYGRSIELAIAGYLLDNGKFPTSIGDLSIEYSGDEVICSTTQLNDDSSVYLTGCTVKGRTVDYTYGEDKTPQAPTYKAYSISQTASDTVTYNNEEYYVIENSDTTQSTIKLLKAEPLNAQKISDYKPAEAQTSTYNGYTNIKYHSNSSAYDGSYVKTTVDAWKAAKAPATLEARLISFEELTENLGIEYQQVNPTAQGYKYTENTPGWVYNSNYLYWTISPCAELESFVWCVGTGGSLEKNRVDNGGGTVVRPVIVLPKSELQS